MTKSELIEKLSEVNGLTRHDAESVITTIFDSMSQALRDGDKVEIRGLGSFTTRVRIAKMARNPKTGEPVKIPVKKAPFFKVGKDLRERVNSITG